MPTDTIIYILFILNHLRVKEGYTTSLSLMIAYTITFSDALSVNSNDCPLSLTLNLNNTGYIYYNVDLIATNSFYLEILSFCFHTLSVQSGGLIGTFSFSNTTYLGHICPPYSLLSSLVSPPTPSSSQSPFIFHVIHTYKHPFI